MFGDPQNNIFNFKIANLKDISVGNLSYGATASAVDFDGQTRYVRITDITDQGGLNDDVKSAATVHEKYLLSDGDILFARTGATVGKTCRYRSCYGKAIYAGFLIRLIPNTNIVLPDYVFYFTKSDYYNKFVADTQRVVAQPNINAQEYGKLKILLPPIEKQKQFEIIVNQSDKSKFEIKKSIENINELIKSLLQQDFNI